MIAIIVFIIIKINSPKAVTYKSQIMIPLLVPIGLGLIGGYLTKESKHQVFSEGGEVKVFKVFIDRGDDLGTKTIATFDTKKEAESFMYDYLLKYPEAKLNILYSDESDE
jgi:hypothetical protein